MECRKCGSSNISIQAVTHTRTKGKGWFYWLFGWFIDIFIWIFLFLPRLIISLFRSRKIVSKTYKMAICQNCGNSWKV